MANQSKVLREYECAFRDLVTYKNISSRKKITEKLRLNKTEDWSFICTSLDVIGDTASAINNFLEYGLEGHSDGDDAGEKYLRLYGVLNAAYLQQFALLDLHRKCNVPDPKKILEKIKTLEVFELRNKLGAHSVDYLNNNKELENYVLIQNSMKGYTFQYMNNDSMIRTWVDVRKCLVEHLEFAIFSLDKIYVKYIETIHRGEDSKIKEHLNRLSSLRAIKL